jgi:hypothetical protein
MNIFVNTIFHTYDPKLSWGKGNIPLPLRGDSCSDHRRWITIASVEPKPELISPSFLAMSFIFNFLQHT